MCVHNASKLVTSKYGLARHTSLAAGPYNIHGDRIAVSSGKRPCATAGGIAEHPQSGACVPGGRGRQRRGRRGGRNPQDAFGMAGVAACGSDAHQQPVEEQNGQRHQETVRQRRSVHNARPAHRPGHGGHRLLVVGQLLVAGPRRPRGDRGLTNGQAAPQSGPDDAGRRRRRAHQRRQHLVDVLFPVGDRQLRGTRFQPGKRLAPGREHHRPHHQRRQRILRCRRIL